MQTAVIASQSKTDQELKQLEAQVRDFGHASLAEVQTDFLGVQHEVDAFMVFCQMKMPSAQGAAQSEFQMLLRAFWGGRGGFDVRLKRALLVKVSLNVV